MFPSSTSGGQGRTPLYPLIRKTLDFQSGAAVESPRSAERRVNRQSLCRFLCDVLQVRK
jgi:hypothetical protein